MKQSELPRCPTCGNAPEYAFKSDQFGWVRGGLKCPYNCHRVQLDSPAASLERAEERLAPQWVELVANIRKGIVHHCAHCGGIDTCSEYGCTATDQMLERYRTS